MAFADLGLRWRKEQNRFAVGAACARRTAVICCGPVTAAQHLCAGQGVPRESSSHGEVQHEGTRDNVQDMRCQAPNSFSGRTRRLRKPEIHMSPIEKDVTAKAPQGQCCNVSVSWTRGMRRAKESSGWGGGWFWFGFPPQNPRFASES